MKHANYAKIPTLEDVNKEIKSRERVGLFALCCFMPIITMIEEASADSNIETMANKEIQQKMYAAMMNNDTTVTMLKYGLKRMNDIGVIDEDYVEK